MIPEDGPIYELNFVRQCLRLIARGYGRLNSAAMNRTEEPAITGELVRTMKEIQDNDAAPGWMDHLFVSDDPPINSPGRLGKKRVRVDIEFERSSRSPRLRLQFEAKRLYRNDSVSEYLGDAGLGMFTSGQYAAQHNVAGMLGYVQTGSISNWADRIDAAMAADTAGYCLRSPMAPVNVTAELPNVRVSSHERTSVGRALAVYHAFLTFTEQN
jgi:hypothetical protein